MAEILPKKTLSFWALTDRPPTKLSADIRSTDLRDIREPGETLEWERGTYALSGVVVLCPSASAGGNNTGRRCFEMLVMSQSRQGGLYAGYTILETPPADDEGDGPHIKGVQPIARRLMTSTARQRQQRQLYPIGERHSSPWESLSWPQAPFEPRSGQINEYTISLPDELIATVREKLKNPSTAP